jgi:hypothetical protein
MAPRFRIGAHVASYGSAVVFCGILALAVTQLFTPSEKEKRLTLERKYPTLVKQSTQQNKNMQDFLNKMKRGDAQLDESFDELLKGGLGQSKRPSNNKEAVLSAAAQAQAKK